MLAFNHIKTQIPLGIRKTVKVKRASLFERLGSERYSRPALFNLDTKLLEYLPERGRFLEVGANDGFSQSNTYYLERRRGWTGVLIEPIPSLFRRCRRLRTASQCFNVACVAEPSEVVVQDLDLLSVVLGHQETSEEQKRLRGTGTAVTIPGMRISDVIDQAGFTSLDLISVDVEGTELSLLRGLDMDRHTPAWMLIETEHLDSVAEVLDRTMELVGPLSFHDYLFQAR